MRIPLPRLVGWSLLYLGKFSHDNPPMKPVHSDWSDSYIDHDGLIHCTHPHRHFSYLFLPSSRHDVRLVFSQLSPSPSFPNRRQSTTATPRFSFHRPTHRQGVLKSRCRVSANCGSSSSRPQDGAPEAYNSCPKGRPHSRKHNPHAPLLCLLPLIVRSPFDSVTLFSKNRLPSPWSVCESS
jgi:hypothetical protein